jgi:hypothetical protein
MNFNPKQIIFQPDLKTTVVVWEDDSRTVVRCSKEEAFVQEVGFAMALVKKIFPNRTDFLRMIDKAYVQPVKAKKEKKVEVKPNSDNQDVIDRLNELASI